MKNTIILLLLTLAIPVMAQDKQDKGKIRELKKEFIKKKLALTTDEEKKFIPLYDKFLDENDALMVEFKDEVDLADVDLTFMTDAECEKLINDIIAFKQKQVDLIKKYTEEFKKVLPIKKVAMIFKAEVEFRKSLKNKLKEKMKEKRREKKEE